MDIVLTVTFFTHIFSCNHEIDWMHCETTVDPDGTWEGSWEALEKAYAEGRVMAIGASNFNINLLDSFDAFTVRPHVVQNWAEPGSMDLEVLYWTRNNAAVYQPYASLRNLHQLQADPKVAEVTHTSPLPLQFNGLLLKMNLLNA